MDIELLCAEGMPPFQGSGLSGWLLPRAYALGCAPFGLSGLAFFRSPCFHLCVATI